MNDDFPAPVYVPGHYRIDERLERQATDFEAAVTLSAIIFAIFVLCAVLS